MIRSLFITTAALAAAAVSLPALADTDAADQRPRRAVSFADLDLTSPAGQAVLDRRLRRAITEVCPRADIRDLPATAHNRACTKAALADASRQRDLAIAAAQSGARVATIELQSRAN